MRERTSSPDEAAAETNTTLRDPVRTLSVVYPRIQNMGSRNHVALHRLHNYTGRINTLIKLNALPIGYFALERSDSFSFSSIS